jgi:prevent-host-death family protein
MSNKKEGKPPKHDIISLANSISYQEATMFRSLPATEVKNRLGRVLREVAKSGGPIYVERDGKPVAVLLSITEFERTRRKHAPSGRKKTLLENVFGMWSGRAEVDDNWVTDGRSRWESAWPK